MKYIMALSKNNTEKKKVEKIHLGDAPSVKRVIDEQAIEVCCVIYRISVTYLIDMNILKANCTDVMDLGFL